MIITIDGPSSVGKGTLASRLVKHYNFAYFDTGMVYRAVAVEIIKAGADVKDQEVAHKFAKSLSFDRMMELSKHPEFRGPLGGQYAAIVATYPKVREALIKMQQDFASSAENVLMDGRDAGTVICPHADLKFFITASIEVRAKRRYKYYQENNINTSYEETYNDIAERDRLETTRKVSPLKPALDAIIIDTSNLNADQAFAHACQIIDERIVS